MKVVQLKRFCREFPNAIETLYGDPYNFLVYSVGGKKFAYFKTSANCRKFARFPTADVRTQAPVV